jgi:hypothetical protein
MQRPQKITFGEMRESGVRGVLIYCSDYHCSYYITAGADVLPRLGKCTGQKSPSCGQGFQLLGKVSASRRMRCR